MTRYFLLLSLSVFYNAFSFGQTTLEESVCPNGEAQSSYINSQYKAGDSDKICDSGTQIRFFTRGDVNIAQSIEVRRLDSTPGPHRVEVEIIWKGEEQGVIYVDVEYNRRKKKNAVKCEWRGWTALYTYKISRVSASPGGYLSSNELIKTSRDGETDVTFILEYVKDPAYDDDISQLRYFIDGEIDAYTGGTTLYPKVRGFGTYTISTEIVNYCGDWVEGPSEIIEVKPNCYQDGQGSAEIFITGDDFEKLDEGYKVFKGQSYTINSTGITDFDSHYEIDHDGGQDISISNSKFTMLADLGSYRVQASKKEGRDECPNLEELSVFVGGSDLTIGQKCLLTLPEDLSNFGFDLIPGEPALEHFAATVTSEKGFVIKPGIVLSKGAELILDYEEPEIDDTELNANMNFIETRSYDEYGRIIEHNRKYYDDRGKLTQTQYKNLTKDVVLASEVLYDEKGRIAINTLAAPVKSGTFEEFEDECGDQVQTGSKVKFEYANNFVVTDEGNKYDYKAFDGIRESEPKPVGSQNEGTLGWYYSEENGTSLDHKLNESNVAHTDYPYSRTVFHHSGTDDVKSISKPGDVFHVGSEHVNFTDRESVDNDDTFLREYINIRESELGLTFNEAFQGNFYKIVNIDEQGFKTITYQDKSKNSIISLYYGGQSTPIIRSYQFYDEVGRLIVSVSPNGWVQYNSGVNFGDIDKARYLYDSRGRLITTVETDAGRTDYLYREDGNIRFSQNEKQKTNNSFSYTNYDKIGRPIESGELHLNDNFDFRNLLSSETEKRYAGWINNLPGSPEKKDWIKTVYDDVDPNFQNQSGLDQIKQEFIDGAVSFTQNENTKTWYSYDEIGRVKWVAQKINGFGVKLIEYTYGPTGAVQLIAYQRGQVDQFYHYYAYDDDGRLSKVYTATEEPVYNLQGEIENPGVLNQQAIYDYYLHGPLKRIELADQLQGIDFVYTITGQLKSINSPNKENDPGLDGQGESTFKPDVFGIAYDYYNGDHQNGVIVNSGTEQFTGNIKAQSWFSPVDGNVQRGYVYDYDDRNQLLSASFGDVNTSSFTSASNAFNVDLNNGFYDANGNIKGLIRRDDAGSNLHDLNYNYVDNKNQLDNVTNSGNPFKSYEYNEIGQLVIQRDEINNIDQIQEYDVTGKVTAIYLQEEGKERSKLAEYFYDDRGFRVSKVIYEEDGITEADRVWYVRDASGTLIRTYSNNNRLDEYPIYGSGRIGMYRPNAIWNDYLYELNDHLGNVRAVLGKDITVEYLGTFEDEREVIEDATLMDAEGNQGYFANWNSHGIAMYNHTTPDITEDGVPLDLVEENIDGVLRINNFQDVPMQPIGATKMIPVSPGDKIDLEVFVQYASFFKNEESIIGNIFEYYLANAFGNLSVGNSGSGEAIGNIFDPAENPLFDPEDLFADPDEDQPKAYLNYIIFDKNFKVIASDRRQVTEAARVFPKLVLDGGKGFVGNSENGEFEFDQEHERLAMEDIVVNQAGFMYVYLSNEDAQDMDVYFDDLRISHSYTNVVAGSDFYPFGLTMQSRDINREKYRYGYQGEYAEEDDETGWNSFELRMYDPVISRWLAVDPYRVGFSPYIGMGNNPVNKADPDGGCPTGDCPGYEEGVSNSDVMLEGVTITASGGGMEGIGFDAIFEEMNFAGSFNVYVQKYPEFAGMSHTEAMANWDSKYAEEFGRSWAARAAYERGQQAVAKMKFFAQGYAYTSIGLGALGGGSSATPKQFSYTSRYNGLRSRLINNEYFVDTRGAAYWSQPGHAQFPRTINRIIIRNGRMHWNTNNSSYNFSINGYRNGSYGRYDLGVRPDGGIFHSTFYKF